MSRPAAADCCDHRLVIMISSRRKCPAIKFQVAPAICVVLKGLGRGWGSKWAAWREPRNCSQLF